VSSVAQFQSPPMLVFGAGARRQVGHRLHSLGIDRALLVTDPWMVQRGTAGAVADEIAASGVEVFTFDRVQPDPTDANVADGLHDLAECEAGGIVALGGGSVIDAAKMIAVMQSNPGSIDRYEGYHQIPNAGLPLLAVPTTAGTGSETTRVSVITDSCRHTKMMILDEHLVPAAAFVDSDLSATMPAGLTAHVGVDTLTHGIEAYVSLLANPLTDLYALSCIDLVGRYLQRAFQNPADLEAREGMALAASQGGLAFSNSSVCLVHAMSRPIGAVFHVPHGLSNAMLLPAVTRFSVGAAPARYATVARALNLAGAKDRDESACELLVAGLEALNDRLAVPRLRAVEGIDRNAFTGALGKMAADAIASGSADRNPVVPTAEEIMALYREAW
jgi:alcohol dehydrogenase class IV